LHRQFYRVILAGILLSGFCYAVDASEPGGYVEIGNVGIRVTEDEISIRTPAGVSNYDRGPGMMYYEYLLTTYKPHITGMDGVVYTNSTLLAIPDRPLKPNDFPMFSFFSKEPTTIGLLFGYGGASGGSSQQLALIDTESGTKVDINMSDMGDPLWREDTTVPPSYAETEAIIYMGAHVISLGYAPRISKAYSFRNGQYERDAALESRLFKKKFAAVKLTDEDMDELKEDDLTKIDRRSAVRFLDYVYYGTKSGNTNAVKALLKSASETVKNEVESYL
jgi:hypothetical protein